MLTYVSLQNVGKTYASQRGSIRALQGINLDIYEGEFVSIVGPSGCGKSTLLRCIAGLDTVSEGRLRIKGKELDAPPDNMGIVFQRDVLLDWRTVVQNVLLPIEFGDGRPQDFVSKADSLLRLFGLNGFENRYPWELSGGMRQRAAISRSLIRDPALLLMDEPFGAVDALTRDVLNIELQKIWDQSKKTVLFITHSIAEAVLLSDRIVVMKRSPGEIVEIVDVNLPRPRALAIRETPVFSAYAKQIRETFERLGFYKDHA
jgi:NitT/TauT family transport system ATP-binding protein